MQNTVNLKDTRSAQGSEIFVRRESEARSYCRKYDAVFEKAKGSFLYDSAGNEYIDFLAGCSSLNYGHNDDDLKSALLEHIARDGVCHGLDLYTDEKSAFLSAFETLILKPRELDYKVQFTGPTGANAVEAAMKLARKITGRRTIVAFTNGFHGVTQGALAATGARYHRMGGQAAPGDVARAAFDGYFGPDVDTAAMLAQLLDDPSSGYDKPAAILLETVQGEGGLNAATAEWVRRIADIAKRHGALLIVDDIQAGCGRTGGFFSFDNFGIVPDMVTMAKSLSGFGLPMSAVLIKPEHDTWQPAEHNGTFRGNTHAFVTARAALEKFWSTNAFTDENAMKASTLHRRLQKIASLVPDAHVVGRGMMQGVDFGTGEFASAVCRHCFKAGLIIETSGRHDQVVKVLAPLTTTLDVLNRGLDIVAEATSKASEEGVRAA